ncbi:hypothetical protein GCM10029992_03660 [Glycomyces albus]
MDDALNRAQAYIEAGADGIMIHSRQKESDEIFTFCDEYAKFDNRKPLVVVPTSYRHVTEEELIDHGVNVVIYANHMMRASYPAMSKVAHTILESGRALEVDPMIAPIKDALAIIPENAS